MDKTIASLGNCKFEILTEAERFLGLGAISIGGTQVRSGRLPLTVYMRTFGGLELDRLLLEGVDENDAEIRIRTRALFRPLPVKLMRDHSFDPIHETGDWDTPTTAGEGRLDIVLRPATDAFNEAEFAGFSYHYEYKSEDVPIFWIMDKASWELGGDIAGATVYNQSSCSSPVAHFGDDTEWTTEGIIHWEDDGAKGNPVMTHNLPRWASHQAFDYQFKDNATLLGVFERVELIRSVLRRDAGRPELKTFDKHIFDETLEIATDAKKILLNTDPKTETDQQNLWTWVMDVVHDRARAEFGLKEEPVQIRLQMNYWVDFTIDTYYKDLLPAAANMGIKSLFIDNVNKSAMTEHGPHRDWNWNMCCGHEYEPAPLLGGPKKLKEFVECCTELGIVPFSWTNNDQAHSSPINKQERDERGWFVKLEDTRLKYGGAYAGCMSVLNFGEEAPRRYWVDCLKKIRETTGLSGYLFDSFYNLGFMPVSYADCRPTTQWRGTLAAVKELQDADVHFMIESFGPFGEVQHGCPTSYNIDNLFACYKVGLGTGYTTVPTGQEKRRKDMWPADLYYRILGHMAKPGLEMFIEGKRVDTFFTDAHKHALADYNNNRCEMHRRYLQEDDQAVLWHNEDSTRATLWNFAARDVALPGTVRDLTADAELPPADTYHLEACHTYAITGCELPTTLS